MQVDRVTFWLAIKYTVIRVDIRKKLFEYENSITPWFIQSEDLRDSRRSSLTPVNNRLEALWPKYSSTQRKKEDRCMSLLDGLVS